MSEIDLPATITALAGLVIAIGVIVTAVLAFLNRRAAAASVALAAKAAVDAAAAKEAAEASLGEIVATKDGVFEVGKRLDGRFSEFLEAQKLLARANGFTAGEQAQRDRDSEPEK